MVYGNLVFIKKTGGDGSKFPVTKRDIKIGRSEDCLIRIYNPQVEPEHCQLIIGDNGQTTLRNLSKQTILNGKPLAQGDVTLSHGDVFKLGERSVRWEYLPATKNSKQLLSPSGRLVAVVMPQQRFSDFKATPGTSASQSSSLKSTPLGKRKYSERGTSEGSPAVKVSKTSGKLFLKNLHGVTGRHSQPPQLIFNEGKGKQRKSAPGVVRVIYRAPEKSGVKSRKSTISSWKVDIRSPPEHKSEGSKKSPTKSSKKSIKSPKSAVKTTTAKGLKPSQELLSSPSKSGMKTPQRVATVSKVSEVLVKSSSKVKKTPLRSSTGSPFRKREARLGSARRVSKSPSPKKSPPKSPSKAVISTPKLKVSKLAKLTQSESKIRPRVGRHSALPKGTKRMSLILEKYDSVGLPGLIQKLRKSVPHKKVKLPDEVSHHSVSQTNLLNEGSPVKGKQARKSVKGTPANKSPRKTPKKSLLRKSVKTPSGVKGKTPRKSVIISLKKKPSSPGMSISEEVASGAASQTPPLIDSEYTPSPKKAKATPLKSSKISSPGRTPATRTPLLMDLDETPSPVRKGKVTPRKSAKIFSPGHTAVGQTPLLMDFDESPSPKKGKATPRKSAKISPTCTPVKSAKTPGKLTKSVGKSKSPSRKASPVRRSDAGSLASSPMDIAAVKSAPNSPSPTRRSSAKESPVRQAASASKPGVTSPRGIRRKLSPSSSAERAAKMLKTSSPKKPDKNKKAALLVLGKANRKQLLPQNMKVLLKQKIVKKAIKQSTAVISQKAEVARKPAHKVKKVVKKVGKKSTKKIGKKKNSVVKSSPPKASRASDASPVKSPTKDKVQEGTPKSSGAMEAKLQSPPKAHTSVRLSSKGKIAESPVKSPPKQNKKPESPRSIMSAKSFMSSVVGSPVQNYLFLSNRRSKRLSSKNDTDRPDFIELSPTALGLMPKNVPIFKTPKDTKRRSSSLVTPKSIRTTGIIKSASTSKIGNRKNVRFSSKDVSYNSDFHTPNTTEKAELDFSSYNTPDVTVDTFVSPLTEKNSTAKKDLNVSKFTSATGSKSKPLKIRGMSSEPQKCVRKILQSPKGRKTLDKISPSSKSLPRSSRSSASKSPSPAKPSKASNESPAKSIRQLFPSPKAQKSPKNSLSDLKGVRRLMRTPKVSKSPKNDLTDVTGVKKLFQTPKVQKSPKNDLTDIKGVKKLLQTPKPQKSPKNDLTDLAGVKKLMQTPKVQKSPKNDLTDVRGVKKMMRTPKVQKSPKNDLRDLRGVKKLMRTPKAQKSPKNDLTNVDGLRQLLGSPRVQRSPKNDLSDVRGVKKLLGSPKVQKSPKNDLTDVTGVKKLLTTPRAQKSPKNNLLDVSGLGSLFKSPVTQKLSRTSTAAMKMLASPPESRVSLTKSEANITGVKQLLISKSPENASKSAKSVSRKSHVKDYRAIRGRRTIYATPKGPKNDLSDVSGVRELFSRHKPISDYNINLTGVAELFDLPNAAVGSNRKKEKAGRKSTAAIARKTPAKRSVSTKWDTGLPKLEKALTRGGRLRRGVDISDLPVIAYAISATEAFVVERGTESKTAEVKKPARRKAAEKVEMSQTKKSAFVLKKSKKAQKETKTSGKKSQAKTETKPEAVTAEVTRSRKRKVQFEEAETPPAKLLRKQPAIKKTESTIATATASRTTSRSRKEAVSKQKASPKSVKKVSASKDTKTSKVNTKVQSKTAIKSGTKKTQKVQNRSQSSSKTKSTDSEEKTSPRKTRSGKTAAAIKPTQKKVSKTQSKAVGKKTTKGTAGRSKSSPVVKRSTRRK